MKEMSTTMLAETLYSSQFSTQLILESQNFTFYFNVHVKFCESWLRVSNVEWEDTHTDIMMIPSA
jgi:hypothetical protein